MLKFISTKEGQIFTFGVLLLLTYLGVIISTYLFSVEDANNLIVITVTNFLFGRAAGISYGYSAGFDDLVIIVVNIVIELITVLLIYPLFVFSWKKSSKIRGLENFFSKVKEMRIKYSDFFEKYGKYGLFIFVWFPFWMTGPVVGAIIGFLIGIRHFHTMLIVITGTSLAIVVWTYSLKELIALLSQLSAYAPYILLGIFITIAVLLKLMKSKQ
jgi:uncharacterized membrane protein